MVHPSIAHSPKAACSSSDGTPPLFEVKDLNLEVRGLTSFPLVQAVSYSLNKGEALALVGESGCGKSLTCWSSLGLPPRGVFMTANNLTFDGVQLAGPKGPDQAAFRHVRGKRIAMIFQDPIAALNPVRKVGQFLGSLLKAHRGMNDAAATAEAVRLLDAVGISEAKARMISYPHELSGGQCQRVMIAGALSSDPDIIIADEPTTALDVTTQTQIMQLLGDLRRDRGMALLIVSHDLGVIAENADRVAVMYAGRIVETGQVSVVFEKPNHPYTAGLLRSVPPETGHATLTPIPGNVPSLAHLPAGCAFAARCERARQDPCSIHVPPLAELRTRATACWFPVVESRP